MWIVCWLNLHILFLLWIPADTAYTEEEEWSDEFDDDTLGMIVFIVIIEVKHVIELGAMRFLNKMLLNSGISMIENTIGIV